MDIRRETAKLRETSELIMDDETVTLPPTAVEKEVDGLTRDMGAPYMDVDAELFLSAHGLPQNTREAHRATLRRLFAPPVGLLWKSEVSLGFRFRRREREMISAARRKRAIGCGKEEWQGLVAGVGRCAGRRCRRPVLDDANSVADATGAGPAVAGQSAAPRVFRH